MKIQAARADRFLDKPDSGCAAVLIYGPDGGMVRERGRRAVKAVVDDPSDPFRVAEITGATLKDDPARLADEVNALSLTGGDRVVWLRGAADGDAAAVKFVLTQDTAGAFLIVEAGDLNPRSSLRKLFEQADNAAAIPCYADDRRSLQGLIQEVMEQHGLSIAPDATAFLCDHLGADRMMSRNELEKLAVFAADAGRVTVEDALACVGDSTAAAMDDVAYSIGDGNATSLVTGLHRASMEGVEPIQMLRAVQRHFQRLKLCADRVAGGVPADKAVSTLRPPVFFKRVDGFRRQLGRWRPQTIDRALVILTEAEVACKTTGIPARAACENAFFRLTSAGRRGR